MKFGRCFRIKTLISTPFCINRCINHTSCIFIFLELLPRGSSSCFGMSLRWLFYLLCFSWLCYATVLTYESNNGSSRVEISFSSAKSPLEYQSNIVFDPQGMEHLYFITQMFLDFIMDQGVPDGILTRDLFKDPIEVIKKNQKPLTSHFTGPVIVALSSLSLAVLIPFIGLIFCCCRCASRCGGRKGVPEKRRDSCKRGLCSLFFFPFVVALLFGLVCAFVTNEYVEQGIHALPVSLEKSSGDINTFLVNTRAEVNTLLIDNFKQLKNKLENTLDRSGETVKNRLGEVSKAVAVDNLTVIVSRLEEIQQHLKSLIEFTVQIQQSTGQLQLGLRNLQKELVQTLEDCNNRYCREELEQQNFAALDVITDTSKLPNLNPVVQNVSALLSNNIREEITKGKVEFDKLSNTIQKAVNKTVPDIKGKIAQVGEELTRTAIAISDSLFIPQLQETKKYVDQYGPVLSFYSRYRWYACLICCTIMLLIVLFFSFGLSCGVCGNERNGNLYAGDTGCNRNKGACFLLCGVALVFLFSFCLLIVTTALFLVGSMADRSVCDTLSNSSSPQLRHFIDLLRSRDENSHDLITAHRVDYLEVLYQCSQNATLYRAFEFDKYTRVEVWPNKIIEVGNFSDIKSYRERYQLDHKLQDFLHQISINPSVILLTPEGTSLLERLRDTPISNINFDVYLTLGENGLTGVNLMEVSKEITEKADLLPSSHSRTANHLKNLALQLESYETKLVYTITETIKKLKMVVKKLKNEAEYNGKDLQKAIAQLLEQAKWAQSFISTKGREELRKLATEFVNEFTILMDRYADHVQYQVEEVVGKCGPINRAYKASYVSVCDEIVQPFNGYWVSLGFCVLICLPAMIVAIILSVLYRRVDPYPTPLGDIGHRKTGRTERGSYENRIGFIHDYSPGCGEMIPLSRSSRDYSMSPESPTYPLFAPLSATPTAPDIVDWTHDRNNPILLPEYSKPPPYNYPVV